MNCLFLKDSCLLLRQAPRRILDEDVTVRLSSCSDTIILQTPPVPPRSGRSATGSAQQDISLVCGQQNGVGYHKFLTHLYVRVWCITTDIIVNTNNSFSPKLNHKTYWFLETQWLGLNVMYDWCDLTNLNTFPCNASAFYSITSKSRNRLVLNLYKKIYFKKYKKWNSH